jgi:hypothetical protein
MFSLPSSKRLQQMIFLVIALGILWRLFLIHLFWGWEESDYGNLQMVRGVFDSGFMSYDMNHMPGYYAVAALFLFFVSDTVWASIGSTLLAGCTAFVLSILLQQKLAGRIPALILGILLLFQPEFSLYSASSLREPLYTAYLMGMLYCLIQNHFLGASILAALSFTVRFEAPVVLFPLLIHLLFRKEQKMPFVYVIPMLVMISLWMWYCNEVFGHVRFWEHAGSVNIETGLGEEAQSFSVWLKNGFAVSFELLFGLLPHRLGWGIFVGLCLSPFTLAKTNNIKMLQYMGFSLLFVWLSIAFIAQHEPQHNLYWKWLYPLLPFLMILGVLSLWKILEKGNRRWFWMLVLLQAISAHGFETKRQIERSQKLYKPQVQIADELERQFSNGHLILDNIPACWLGRRSHEMRLTSWFDVPTSTQSEFAIWLYENDVDAVLWFAEEWTQAPKVAPFLEKGGVWKKKTSGKAIFEVELLEVARDDDYGWILYQRRR